MLANTVVKLHNVFKSNFQKKDAIQETQRFGDALLRMQTICLEILYCIFLLDQIHTLEKYETL